ncbi:MAG: prepilin-type N-terminal cleavage/methylation domain-containing protein [Acidobacteriota bacterium]|nr:prepilin-type N-terminal cleavage/methylation domain-containing protein [Acidobacteriota bacterium]
MSKSRGFTLIEVLVALLILTIVITTTIAMFVERRSRLRQANETILAYQALSNEAEIWRRIGFGQLDAQPMTFQSDTAILGPLAPFATTVHVDTPRADVKSVTFTIRWANAQRTAKLSIVRADTGGNGLW